MNNNSAQEAVTPITPAAPYIGGKLRLSKRLAEMISNVDHVTYAEPFVGMGGVFFKRIGKPKAEIINDVSGDVINLFRLLQRHYPQLMETMKFQLTSRREFERLAKSDPDTLTDLERAARFLYLQRAAFGGKVTGQSFGVSIDRPARFNLTRLGPILEDIHERLSGCTIENIDWREFILRYDKPDTLFYLDPPYWGNENDYGKGVFGRDQFAIMATTLSAIKGRFILSINNNEQVRECFKLFNQEPVDVPYSIGNRQKSMVAKELIISNMVSSGRNR